MKLQTKLSTLSVLVSAIIMTGCNNNDSDTTANQNDSDTQQVHN